MFKIAMAARDFKCILCQRNFTLLSGDLMVPTPVICDECLVEVWQLGDDALARYVSKHLAENASPHKEYLESMTRQGTLEDSIIQDIQGLKERWTSVQDVIQDRELNRQTQD